MLIAARPDLIKPVQTDIPDNFTLFSAAVVGQTTKTILFN
jgi:hypothetical protein